MWHDMWNDGWMMHSWGWPWLFFLGLIIFFFLVFLVLRDRGVATAGGPTEVSPRDDAMETLRERFARGDISEEEFEEKKRHLQE